MKFSLTNPLTGSALTTLALLTVGLPASAQITNGSFETDALKSTTITGWNTIGSTYIADSAFGDTPTNGSKQAFLNNDAQAFDSYGLPTNKSVSAASLESFLGVTDPALTAFGNGTVVDGTGIKQTFTLATAGTLSFNYDFVTTEDSTTHKDFAFVALSGSKTALTSLAAVADATTLEPTQTGRTSPSIDDYFSETGYKTYTTTLGPGTYTLGLGVVDVDKAEFGSGLLVDNVHFAPVPEARTSVSFALLLGLGGLLIIRRVKSGAKA